MAGLVRLDLRSAFFIAAEGIAASLLGHLAYYHALKAGEASRVAPITAAFPAVTALAAFLILGERLTWTKGLGVLLVVAGLALLKG